jgi:hypothetical protein
MTLEANFTGITSLNSGVTPTGVVLGEVGVGVPSGLTSRLGIFKSRIDASLVTHQGAADVYEAIKLPAYCHVLSAWFEVVNPETTHPTSTVALGIHGGTTDGFVTTATVAVADTPHAITNAGTYMAAGGYSCTGTANTIDLITATGGLGDAVIDVYALVLDQSHQ